VGGEKEKRYAKGEEGGKWGIVLSDRMGKGGGGGEEKGGTRIYFHRRIGKGKKEKGSGRI